MVKNATRDDEPVTPAENVSPEEYSTKGKTTVATRRGYAFVSSNRDLPVITHDGVQMTAEEADFVVAESDGEVEIRTDQEGE